MGENPSKATDASLTPESSATSPARSAHNRAFLLRLHFYAGIFVGPFLADRGRHRRAPRHHRPTIEQFVYRDQLRTTSSGDMLPVSEQVRAAQTVRPDLPVTCRGTSGDRPGETTRVMFDDPSLGESERHAVFIDPVTAASRGELTGLRQARCAAAEDLDRPVAPQCASRRTGPAV